MVLPSLIEGLPGAILEAGAAGIPCVASRIGGIPEVVNHGETGVLVPPGDSEAFCGAVLELLKNSVLRSQMGLAARARIQQRFELEKVVDQFEARYETLIRARPQH